MVVIVLHFFLGETNEDEEDESSDEDKNIVLLFSTNLLFSLKIISFFYFHSICRQVKHKN